MKTVGLLGGMSWESTIPYYRIINEGIDDMKDKGCEGVILGCTEIGLLIKQTDVTLPVFDTTAIHANRAVELALGEG